MNVIEQCDFFHGRVQTLDQPPERVFYTLFCCSSFYLNTSIFSNRCSENSIANRDEDLIDEINAAQYKQPTSHADSVALKAQLWNESRLI